ncbi:MAG: radical SAM protein [Candidatus Bathyarchaeota archaeon]|nr:radical SAM protein [Candidatus Bathyarchaeota archaeon]
METKLLLTVFDPWKSQYCTCPPKLTFNPYTGCDHGCLYCYASSYIPNFQNCRPKKNLLSRLEREATKLEGELISISNSSDPYPRLEQKMGLTRKCLEMLAKTDCKLQIITKSDLVTKDIDILQTVPSVVSVTVLTKDDNLSRKLEPGAPVSSKRLTVIQTLIEAGIPTTARIDPVIPFLNDDMYELVETLADLGVMHLTCSTYKTKPDNWKRFSKSFPDISKKLSPLYFDQGERIGGSTYLPEALRFDLMKKAKELTEKRNMKFGCCRESFKLNSGVCDGSWVIRNNL